MKQKVSLSTYSIVFSLIIIFVFIGLMFWIKDPEGSIPLAGLLIIMSLLALFYLPLSMSFDDKQLSINFSLRSKSIPLTDIASIEPSEIAWNAQRQLSSEGFLGY